MNDIQIARISEKVKNVFKTIKDEQRVIEALHYIELANTETLSEQIEITCIPAPTFMEHERGKYFINRFKELGLSNVETDEVGNVFGVRSGTGNGPKLVISAHLDTVFPKDTEIKTLEKDGKVFAPGIADDGRGLAALTTLIRTLQSTNIKTVGDLIFVATVGEEGLGDLRGVKHLFKTKKDIDGFISIEPGSPERTTYLATGSHRYKVSYRGQGGHSFGDFGIPSAIHALGRAIGKIAKIQPPNNPKTTFNVGTIEGGTSVNTIAAEASMVIDIRSTSHEELIKLEETILFLINQAAAEENERLDTNSILVDVELVGERPAGSQDAQSVIVQSALAATESLGFNPVLDDPSSTDSNVPISLGIPAITLGGGGQFGGVHTTGEYFNPKDSFFGVQKILLTLLSLVGMENVTDPLLTDENS